MVGSDQHDPVSGHKTDGFAGLEVGYSGGIRVGNRRQVVTIEKILNLSLYNYNFVAIGGGRQKGWAARCHLWWYQKEVARFWSGQLLS
jgi:hypothetical protein